MNLAAIANAAIQSVTPNLLVVLSRSTGDYENPETGELVPTYADPVQVGAQVQALTSDDLQQISGLNQQGEKLAIYVNGTAQGVLRQECAGGDLIILPDGSTWLVLQVLENWGRMAGWTKVACVRQGSY